MSSKSCPITREEFAASAEPVSVVVNGQGLAAKVKEFSTGSFGWYLTTKVSIRVGGKVLLVQIGMNMTVVGSKDAD